MEGILRLLLDCAFRVILLNTPSIRQLFFAIRPQYANYSSQYALNTPLFVLRRMLDSFSLSSIEKILSSFLDRKDSFLKRLFLYSLSSIEKTVSLLFLLFSIEKPLSSKDSFLKRLFELDRKNSFLKKFFELDREDSLFHL